MEPILDTSVCVVIPFVRYNSYLARAINSALNQIDVIVDIVLVHNNSECIDNNVIYSDYQTQRVKYYHLENCSNANVARNFGASKSSSAYVAFLDSDDEWLPDHIINSIRNLITFKAVVHVSSFYVCKNGAKHEIRHKCTENLLSDLFVTKSIDCRSSTLVVCNKFFDKNKFDEKLSKHQDWGYLVDYHNKGVFYISDTPTVMIHVDSKSRMSSKTNFDASVYFGVNKLEEPYKSNFLFTRLTDQFALGTFGNAKKLAQLIEYKHLPKFKYFSFLLFKVFFIKNESLFSLLRFLTKKYKTSGYVKNK